MTRANDRIGLFANRVPRKSSTRSGTMLVENFRRSIKRMIPAGEAQDTLLAWVEQGLDVSFFRQNMQWHIRVGDRELSVEEYLLLFDEEGK